LRWRLVSHALPARIACNCVIAVLSYTVISSDFQFNTDSWLSFLDGTAAPHRAGDNSFANVSHEAASVCDMQTTTLHGCVAGCGGESDPEAEEVGTMTWDRYEIPALIGWV
jgi:hypothetical protein